MKALTRLTDFLRVGIWRLQARELPRMLCFGLTQLRIVLISVRGFAQDRCYLRASALTFYSLLSVVPVAAMAFGIAKGFGFEEMLERVLFDKLEGQEEVLRYVIDFANRLLENAKGGLIAGVGIVVLLWSVLKVLGNIESSLNHIWGVKRGRSLARRFSDYLSVMLICPVLLIMASSATVLITTQIEAVVERITLLGHVGPLIFFLLKCLPLTVLWGVFTFIYMFMPNTKVRFGAALLGGVVGGTVFHILQATYIYFQLEVATYGAVYGSFAALPLFLLWLQLSWIIVLFGAEVAFARENVGTFEFEPDAEKASGRFVKLLSLAATELCVRNFAEQKGPLGFKQIAQTLETPVRLVRRVLFELTEAGVLSEVVGQTPEESGFQPGRPIESLTVQGVLKSLDDYGSDHIPLVDTEQLRLLSQSLQSFDDLLGSSAANISLANLEKE